MLIKMLESQEVVLKRVNKMSIYLDQWKTLESKSNISK